MVYRATQDGDSRHRRNLRWQGTRPMDPHQLDKFFDADAVLTENLTSKDGLAVTMACLADVCPWCAKRMHGRSCPCGFTY